MHFITLNHSEPFHTLTKNLKLFFSENITDIIHVKSLLFLNIPLISGETVILRVVLFYERVWKVLVQNQNCTKVVDLLEDGYYPNLLMIKYVMENI